MDAEYCFRWSGILYKATAYSHGGSKIRRWSNGQKVCSRAKSEINCVNGQTSHGEPTEAHWLERGCQQRWIEAAAS